MLTDRQATILGLVIQEHIATAAPVGSGTLAIKYPLGLSSATIRNEMAKLEEAGFITHPHTSAGRVPSDLGYRHYVEALMREEHISAERERMIRHQFHQSVHDLDDLVQLAASVLANAVQNLGIATSPRAPETRLKHAQLIELSEHNALLIVVTLEGWVRQQTVLLPEAHDQAELLQISHRLNEAFGGSTAGQIERAVAEDEPDTVRLCREAIAAALRSEAVQPQAHLDGLRNVLGQPEFARSDRMLAILEALDERNLPFTLPLDEIHGEGISIIIGGENRHDALQRASVVVAPYRGPNGMEGALGVIGPTRMQYARAVATVRYLSELMTELLEAIYR